MEQEWEKVYVKMLVKEKLVFYGLVVKDVLVKL